MADVMEIDAIKLCIEFVQHPVIADPLLEFRAALQTWCGNDSNRVPISSTFLSTAARTAGGRSSNEWEKVGDQIWSAAGTTHFGWRVV